MAQGFVTGGYDKDLGEVLAACSGITPRIATSLAPVARRPAGSVPASGRGPAAIASAGRRSAAWPAYAAPAAGTHAGGPQRAAACRPPTQAGRPARACRRTPRASRRPRDRPAPEVPDRAPDLIERELGGRVIQEIGYGSDAHARALRHTDRTCRAQRVRP